MRQSSSDLTALYEEQDRKTIQDRLVELRNSKVIIYSVYAMVLSYFYNLPVMTYSATGNNELRLYDFAGFVILIVYFRNFTLLNDVIRRYKFLSYLFDFLLWATFTMLFTTFHSIYLNRMVWIVQTTLYLFHFYVFFLTCLLMIIMIQDTKHLKNLVQFSLICALISFIIVILQNLGLVPYLWNTSYLRAYHGFLSGTFGPNKIVLGMTCVMMFAMSIGLLNDKRVKVNKTLLISTICISIIVAIITGSRTAYLGLAVFLVYFLIRDFRSFVFSSFVLIAVLTVTAAIDNTLIQMAVEVYENRVEKKIENPEDVQEARVDALYEDLGAGRKKLSLLYVDILSNNLHLVPFGRGFNNRLETPSSAHNIYLSLINEVGLLGALLYIRWLGSYLFVRMTHFPQMNMASKGLVLAMLVTLFFGEHLYVYRALFGLVGLFLFVVTVLTSPLYIVEATARENE